MPFVELDNFRVSGRVNQTEYVLQSEGYKKLLECGVTPPVAPDVLQPISKKEWLGQLRAWEQKVKAMAAAPELHQPRVASPQHHHQHQPVHCGSSGSSNSSTEQHHGVLEVPPQVIVPQIGDKHEERTPKYTMRRPMQLPGVLSPPQLAQAASPLSPAVGISRHSSVSSVSSTPGHHDSSGSNEEKTHLTIASLNHAEWACRLASTPQHYRPGVRWTSTPLHHHQGSATMPVTPARSQPLTLEQLPSAFANATITPEGVMIGGEPQSPATTSRILRMLKDRKILSEES